MLDHQKALVYFQNLYLIAVGDGMLADAEKNYLVGVAQQMGLGVREVSNIMMNIKNLDFIIPDDEHEKLAQLEDVILMMMVDRKIHEREYNLCSKFAFKIGLDKKTLDQLILKIFKE